MNSFNSDIVGTWFSTGFHDHYRSRPRNDYITPYRQRAKPHPPSKFLERAKVDLRSGNFGTQVRSDNHLFSRHDNRNSHASTMGDLEMHFSHGLGKRKTATGAAQHSKSTSSLLTWSFEPSDKNLISSYRSSFNLPSSRSNERSVNDAEPIHSRSNHNLQRRQVRVMTSPPSLRTAPLLAWNDPDYSYSKPCVSTPHYNRVLSRETSNSDTRTNVSTGQSSRSASTTAVVETVTPLNF